MGCVAIVLAGGLSRRMGGGDKGLLDLDGRSMISRVIETIRRQTDRIAINANGDPARFGALGLPVVADTVDGFVGPLAGVLAGMRWAAREAPGASHVLTVSADAPLLPGDLASRLSDGLLGRPTAVAIARSRGEVHPVIGLWPVALADDLEAWLRAGGRKVLGWTDRHGTVPVDFPDRIMAGLAIDPFFNANTPEELGEARALVRLLEASPRPPAVIGVAGWKNSGKTTLVERLVAELTQRGHRVATVKHAHHLFEVDPGATDSARHRRAGAIEVAVVSSRRIAQITEIAAGSEPPLECVLARLGPADIVIVEGYKRAPIAKIEVRRTAGAPGERLADRDPSVIAVAADHEVSSSRVPTFGLDDIGSIADLIAARFPSA